MERKSQYMRNKTMQIITVLFAILSVFGIGFSSFIIIDGQRPELKLKVDAETLEDNMGIQITDVNMVSDLYFDGLQMDENGRVHSDHEHDSDPYIRLEALLTGYQEDCFVGVQPSLRVEERYRSDFDYLIDNGYIVEFDLKRLEKSKFLSPTGSDELYWINDNIGGDPNVRKFGLNYKLAYGSFFNFMNPSEFFDSAYSNGIKLGSEYSTSEIQEILNRFTRLNNANFTLFLDVVTNTNSYTFNFDSQNGSFSGFDSTSSVYTVGDQSRHSKVRCPKAKRDNFKFDHWSYKTKTFTEYFYADEIVDGNIKTYDLSANYTPIQNARLNVSFEHRDVISPEAGANITIMSSSITNKFIPYSESGATYDLKVGDVITIHRLKSLKRYTVDGLRLIKKDVYRVERADCSIRFIPVQRYKLTLELDTSIAKPLSKIKFRVGAEDIELNTTYDSNGNVTGSTKGEFDFEEDSVITLSDIRGVSHFNGASAGEYKVTMNADQKVKITPKEGLNLTVNFTADTGTATGGETTYFVKASGPGYEEGITIVNDTNVGKKNKNITHTAVLLKGEKVELDGENISSKKYSGVDSSQCVTGNVTIDVVGKNGCFIKGTLITLADGSQEAVENLKPGDEIMTWNFFTGKYEAQKIAILVDHGEDDYDVAELKFSDGTELSIIADHGVFDYDLNHFVYLTCENYSQYIGHRFVKYAEESYDLVTLVEGTKETKRTNAYSITSAFNYNSIANGLFTAPPPGEFYNWVEMDGKLRFDVEQFKADVEAYGLYDYSVFEPYGISYETFIAFNGAYLKIPVSKGIFTFDYIIELFNMYRSWIQ